MNPYQISQPVTEPQDFFGRKTEFQMVYEMLLSGDCVNLIGPRRIGKSSFLKVLPTPAMQQRVFGKDVLREKNIFAAVNLQDSMYDTPIHLVSDVTEQLKEKGVEFEGAIQTYADFKKALKILAEKEIRLILLFDEFDSVKQNDQFELKFYNTLRAYQQEFPVSYVVASIDSVKDISESIKKASPFFNIFRYVPLGLLSEDAANDLICKDDSLSLFMRFVKLSAGQHPLFISQLCFYLFHFQRYESGLSPEDLREKAIYRFLKEAFDHFIYYWEHLSIYEKSLLRKLANGKKPDKNDTAELMDLEQKALIIKNNGDYAIFSSAFEGFVKEIEFSEAEEKVAQFFAKNTKALVSVAKYCLDKAVELKK